MGKTFAVSLPGQKHYITFIVAVKSCKINIFFISWILFFGIAIVLIHVFHGIKSVAVN